VGRLLLGALGDAPVRALAEVADADLELADRWILSRLARAARETTEHLEKFRLNDAVGTPYHFLWDDFADWYLEAIRLRGEAPGGDAARAVAAHVFDRVLRLLHPAMPFITEALYRRLPGGGRGGDSIMVAPWPGADAGRDDPEAESGFAFVQALVNAVREVRAEYGVKPGTELPVVVSRAGARQRRAVEGARETVLRLAKVGELTVADGEAAAAGIGSHAVLPDGAELFVALGDAIDVSRECSRLKAELTRLDGQLAAVRAKLGNDAFRSRAPADVVARETEKEQQWSAKRDALAAKLAALGCA